MFRIEAVQSLLPPSPEYAAGSIAAAAVAFISYVSNFAVLVLGVPLPVVMAAVAGACLARAYGSPMSFGSAAFVTMLWAAIGCALAPLTRILLQGGLSKLNVDVPLSTGVLAGIAAVVSASPLWWPVVWPFIRSRFGKKDDNG